MYPSPSLQPASLQAPGTAGQISNDEPPAIQVAALHLYQLYDVAYSIDLEKARGVLATPSARVRPVVTRGASIDIAQLPLEISMGAVEVPLGGAARDGILYARIYDLGIIAFRLVLLFREEMSWQEAVAILAEAQTYPLVVIEAFERGLELLRATLAPAMLRPNEVVRPEDYSIFIVERMAEGAQAATLARNPWLLRAALGERKPLAPSMWSLATTLSYYEDDLILLTWATAVMIESDPGARDDATLLLEFANAQLLSFRTYDAAVERELARITPRLGRLSRARWPLLRSSRDSLSHVHTLIADITEQSSRVENALKVTEDVYWNRLYTAALAALRVETWRTGIAETLDVLRQMAALLHDEEQVARSTLLEILVIVLIAVELVVAILGLRGGIH
ncbi:MAG TPA: hypothetical protein VFX31_12810 [Ktedonobacterales bacterium]|nr:hypothetical protein [Ktedonobacterales bacterium]HEX5572265.1 hypothetical protein [Ktedonobacterales bacterium]